MGVCLAKNLIKDTTRKYILTTTKKSLHIDNTHTKKNYISIIVFFQILYINQIFFSCLFCFFLLEKNILI